MLNRDAILNAQDIRREVVSVPEWGGEVCVQGMSGAQRDEFEQTWAQKADGIVPNIRATFAAWSICDEDGRRLFTTADIEALGRKSANALDRIFTVAQRLSGLSDADAEELVKNSADGQSEDSTLD